MCDSIGEMIKVAEYQNPRYNEGLLYCYVVLGRPWLAGHEADRIFSGYQPCKLVKTYRRFRDHLCPHHLTWGGGGGGGEDFTNFNRRESFRTIYVQNLQDIKLSSFSTYLPTSSTRSARLEAFLL
jgi:hypothetical protein